MAMSIAERGIRRYREMVEQEAWKRDHEMAMACLDLEHLLEYGIWVYDLLVRIEEEWRERVYTTPAAYTEEDHEASIGVFKLWLEPCDTVLDEIRRFEDAGYPVTQAAGFRKRVAECRWCLADPAELFDHERFHALRDRAIAEHRAGRTIPFERMGD